MPLTEAVPSSSDADVDPRLQAALLEFVTRTNVGECMDVRAFVAGHAEIAPELAAALEGLQLLNETRRQLGPVDASGGLNQPQFPLGDFHLIEELGRGGMGVVYAAEQRSLGRRVAIKVLPSISSLDPKQRQRFMNEARAAALITHPHVVPVYAVDCAEGVHYFVMQLIDGCSLGRVIAALRQPNDTIDEMATRLAENAEAGDIFFRTAAKWCSQAADALAAAHELGIVHRDIKPANLLVDVSGKIWVTDFGLARVQGDHALTMTGHLVGTARYMSPEQARGGDSVDARTDIYSLGVTLYELLTLTPAFADAGVFQRRSTADVEPTRPRRINPAVPRDLETIVLTAMAPAPDDRYASAAVLAGDLRRFLDGRPVLARRPGWFDYLRRWLWRHRRSVSALAIAVVLGAGGAFAWTNRRIQVALTRAESERDISRAAALDTIDLARELSAVPAKQHVVKAYLVKTQAYLESLDRTAADAASRFVLARALHEVAKVRNGLGEISAADQLLRRSAAILEELISASPHDKRFRRELADCYRVHSCVLGDSGHYAESVRQTAEALRIYQVLLADDPDSGELLGLLADRHADHARALHAMGDIDCCRREQTEALRLYRLLVERYDDDPQARGRLAGAVCWWGAREAEAGRAEAAENCYREGAALDEWMETRYPHVPGNRLYTLTGSSCLSHWLDAKGESAEAEALFRRYLDGRRRIAAAHSDNWGNWQHATGAHVELARFLHRRGRTDEALGEWRQAVAQLERVAVPDGAWPLRLYLAELRTHPSTPTELRDPAKARSLAEAVTREAPHTALAWMTLAKACRACDDLPATKKALECALSAENTPPARIDTLLSLAEVSLELSDRRAAQRFLEETTQLTNRWFWLAGRFEARREALTRWPESP